MSKVWRVKAVKKNAYKETNTHKCDVYADTLYEAFTKYYDAFGTDSLVKIKITEVQNNE